MKEGMSRALKLRWDEQGTDNNYRKESRLTLHWGQTK